MTNALFTAGLPELDALLGGGFRPGAVNLIAGPAGSGKTTLVDTIVRANAFDRSVPTLLIDCEYDTGSRTDRILAGMAEVPLTNMLLPDAAETTRLYGVQAAYAAAPLDVAEARLTATAVELVRQSPARLIAVDGSLFHSGETLAVLREAAGIGSAVVVTTQFSDAEMAAICDTVVTLARPWLANRADLVVAKARAGRPGEVNSVVAEFGLARFVPAKPLGAA